MSAVGGLTEIETMRLKRCEDTIRQGLAKFVEVGQALAIIRDERLYRHTHETFDMYLRERWRMTKQRAYQLIGARDAAIEISESTNCRLKPESEGQLRPLTRVEPEQQREAWSLAVEAADGEQPTAKQVQAAVDEVRGTPREALHSSETVEWYTPQKYLDAARDVLGAIDLDPASCERANRLVKATRYFTEADDGLAQEWRGRVWLNPPYGKGDDGESNTARWLEKLHAEFAAGRVTEAIALVNATTDRAWFRPLWELDLCFVATRIRFVGPEGIGKQPTHGNVFVYLGHGDQRAVFARVFQQFGRIVVPDDGLSVAMGEIR